MTGNGNAPVPPQNPEAEESVLGAMMLSPNAIEAVAEECSASDFYRKSHGHIFEAALDLHARQEPVDALTLADELEKRGHLGNAGGKVRIHELSAMVPAAGNAGHYARIVRETAGLRSLIEAGRKIAKLGWDRPGNLDELTELAEVALTAATQTNTSSDFVPAAQDLDVLADEIEEAYTTGTPRFGLKTGYLDLDKQLSGLHPGTFTLIAARPGMGKSALGLNIAENVAYKGTAVGIASLEMSRLELQMRMLSRTCKIDSQKLRTGKLSPEEYDRFRKGRVDVKNRTNIYIDDSPGTTPGTLRAACRRLHRQHDAGLIVVDYLQLMLSGRSEESRQQEIANISRSLKLLARELNIPVIAISQLNRNLESRDDKRPRLSDLRDSGALEQDADNVIFIYRDDYYNPDSDDVGIAEINVAKNRMGPPGPIKLAFTGRHSAFKNLA